ncbi:hypothetical protein O181_036190 [Austropuccinia psidii MF-1]|uniref:Uncharacterized protein n=1 Tax=Austropuccinia psidii MF-1 TaxID=1389203 RepID=A0A9Q3D8G3_9BASI|nr:hypothetical protein [Austropuccinia psidii MF-1]
MTASSSDCNQWRPARARASESDGANACGSSQTSQRVTWADALGITKRNQCHHGIPTPSGRFPHPSSETRPVHCPRQPSDTNTSELRGAHGSVPGELGEHLKRDLKRSNRAHPRFPNRGHIGWTASHDEQVSQAIESWLSVTRKCESADENLLRSKAMGHGMEGAVLLMTKPGPRSRILRDSPRDIPKKSGLGPQFLENLNTYPDHNRIWDEAQIPIGILNKKKDIFQFKVKQQKLYM